MTSLGYNYQYYLFYIVSSLLRCHIFKLVTRVYQKFFQPQPIIKSKPRVEQKPETNLADLSTPKCEVIPRKEHNISRKAISENALKVLYRLNKQGYQAYLVGGCVRDLLLGKTPKDFDITTNATPEQVQKTFRNCRLVGRRFRLAHIMFGKEIIEVATFRGEHAIDNDQLTDNQSVKLDANTSRRSQSGMLLRDNVYGNIEQDAVRRDFTINSLYYSVKDFSIRDYCHGMTDLKNGVIRLIGDPETRYREDPVRMLRAVRFAAKLNMEIETKTAAPIKALSLLLKNIPGARLFDESIKLLQSGHGYLTYQLLRKYHLFGLLFPTIDHLLSREHKKNKNNNSYLEQIIEQALKNTDYRITNHRRVNPAYLLAVMLWYPLIEHTQKLILESGLTYHDAFDLAMNDILNEQCSAISIPKRLTITMCDIWRLQLRFNKRSLKRVNAIFEHPKFRAAYDLLELRASIEKGELLELAKWWDEYQHTDHEQRLTMIKQLSHKNNKFPAKNHHKNQPRSKSNRISTTIKKSQ